MPGYRKSTGFSAFQVIPFPQDHTAIANTPERVRLVLVHYDKECGAVGGGDRLNVTKDLFTKTGVNESPRSYRNNLVFLLAEQTASLASRMRCVRSWPGNGCAMILRRSRRTWHKPVGVNSGPEGPCQARCDWRSC